mmetsp:Transcript_30949/g.47199  ORF Transcript_30949/g.47199 Transcript_30949/m.47199 type:complete len:399 (+) Transcript_30949:3-1199(+)
MDSIENIHPNSKITLSIMSYYNSIGRFICANRRFFSNAAPGQSLKIPTRHSRHLPPPACLLIDQLRDTTDEILENSPGFLIPYNSSQRDDAWHAWDLADITVQKVEWLIRGYSAQVENTQMHKQYSIEPNEDPRKCVEQILKLVEKMEEEGKMFMDLRSKMRSQLAVEERKDPDEDLSWKNRDIEINKEANNGQSSDISRGQAFASPGQTIAMFDTLLDTMSMVTDDNTPATVGNIVKRIEERFQQDGGLAYNVNPNTVPTQMTWNAGLRAIANTDNSCEKTRDDALTSAFSIFHHLGDANVKRNSATYAFMVQIVAKYIPPSEISANVAHGLWHLAKEDQVINKNLMKAMELIDSGGYKKHEQFMTENVRGKTIEDIPQDWRKFGVSLRCALEDDTY